MIPRLANAERERRRQLPMDWPADLAQREREQSETLPPRLVCAYCGQPLLKSTKAINRSKRNGSLLYCNSRCMGLAYRNRRCVQHNKYWIIGRSALIDVSTKKHPRAIALIDADAIGGLLGHGRWRASLGGRAKTLYAIRSCRKNDPRSGEFMHQALYADGQMRDHKNHDGLDNRRSNLRVADGHQNAANVLRPPNRSGYRGVFVHRNGYQAQIHVNNKSIFLGVFRNAVDGARAYDKAAATYFGEFAILNFPKGD